MYKCCYKEISFYEREWILPGIWQQWWAVAHEVLWVEESWSGHSLLNSEFNKRQEGKLCNQEAYMAPAIDMQTQTIVPKCHYHLLTPPVPKCSESVMAICQVVCLTWIGSRYWGVAEWKGGDLGVQERACIVGGCTSEFGSVPATAGPIISVQ